MRSFFISLFCIFCCISCIICLGVLACDAVEEFAACGFVVLGFGVSCFLGFFGFLLGFCISGCFGCALLFDDECRAIIDSAYGRSAADNLKSRLDTDRAYGDPVQKQCPSPAAAAKPAMQTYAYAPSTAEPAKPVSEWWPAAEPAKPSSAPKTE